MKQITLLRLAIYLSPLTAFSFIQSGAGLIQPALIPILLALFISIFTFVNRHALISKQIFGHPKETNALIFFLAAAVFSTFLNLLLFGYDSLFRSIGVIISLLVFFLTVYIVSYHCNNIEASKLLWNDFVRVANIITALILIEFLIYNLLKTNYIFILFKSIHLYLPYPSMPFEDQIVHSRFRGILNEPGDVGNFIFPIFAAKLTFFKPDKLLIKNFTTLSFYFLAMLLSASFVVIICIFILCLILVFRKSILFNQITNKMFIYCFSFLIIIFMAPMLIGSLLLLISQFLHPQIQSRISDIVMFLQFQNYGNNTNMSVQSILNSYNAMLISLQQNPLFGVGLGNFSQSYEKFVVSRGLITRINQFDGYSMAIRLASETGIIGLFLFINLFTTRLNQRFAIISKLKSDLVEKDNHKSNIDRTDEYIVISHQISIATLACLVNALLNYPTYWNVVLPIFLGISFKQSKSYYKFTFI